MRQRSLKCYKSDVLFSQHFELFEKTVSCVGLIKCCFMRLANVCELQIQEMILQVIKLLISEYGCISCNKPLKYHKI